MNPIGGNDQVQEIQHHMDDPILGEANNLKVLDKLLESKAGLKNLINELPNPNNDSYMKIVCDSLYSDNLNFRVTGCRIFRKILSIELKPPIEEVIGLGVVPKFISILKDEESNDDLLFESAWALTNISSGTQEQCQLVVDNGCIGAMVNLISFDYSPTVVEQAIWGIGNIAGDSTTHRNLIIYETDGTQRIIDQIQHYIDDKQQPNALSILKNASWTLSNFNRGKPLAAIENMLHCLPTFMRLIFEIDDDDCLIDSLWGLSYLSESGEIVDGLIESDDMMEKLISIAKLEVEKHSSLKLTPCIRILGNIAAGTEAQTNFLIESNGALALFKKIVDNTLTKKSVLKETIWIISNIAAGSWIQIQSLMDHELLNMVISHYCNISNSSIASDVRKEAVYSIVNACLGSNNEQKIILMDLNIVEALIQNINFGQNTSSVYTNLNVLLNDGLKTLLSNFSEKVIEKLKVYKSGQYLEDWKLYLANESNENSQFYEPLSITYNQYFKDIEDDDQEEEQQQTQEESIGMNPADC